MKMRPRLLKSLSRFAALYLAVLLTAAAPSFARALRLSVQPSTPRQNASKPGLAGKWDLTATTPGGQQKATLDLRVADDASITGSVQSQYGDATISSGSLHGNKFNLKFSLNIEGTPTEVSMNGTIDGDSIQGDGEAGDTSFTFTGSRSTAGQRQ
jgi:hypothetical protein